ncbi:MAG: SusC/RagA family TonB-linked outer membrane protein [Bacteroidaceae bacterium]|nr:SusC/RagA family TonB-linked outer membrane protein [Bacteroidaceae bacterium]
MKLLKSVGRSLIAAAIMGIPLSFLPTETWASTAVVQQDPQYGTVKGTVKSDKGEEMIGAVVYVVGTQNSAFVDFDGSYILNNVKKGATIRATLMGFTCEDKIWNGGPLDFIMVEEDNQLEELVVTAMGIMRKEKSLTYATQMVKADDLFKAPDANLINSLEGKVSGITITPSAGGAGGASKITLRGNKSIMGENAPLIVVDGVPMTNSIRGQVSDAANLTYSGASEGSDPLSMINPDDIESMNVLKGANAAALYGSRAANGVIMITTKKGKEGKMEVTFNSSTTFDTPLLTPELQNSYGGYTRKETNGVVSESLNYNSWGDRLTGTGTHEFNVAGDRVYFQEGFVNTAHLRNYANDDISDFFAMGVNTNNSISISGGTEKIQTYASYSNSHSIGMVESNRYNRNTFAFRQTYKLWDRVTFNVSVNYNQSKTKNRVGGGTVGNPIYHLYTTPRDVDMSYYKDNYKAQGEWLSSGALTIDENTQEQVYSGGQSYYIEKEDGTYERVTDGYVILKGMQQQYAFQAPGLNNPYWLSNMANGETDEERFSASFSGTLNIIEGLNLQARVSIDHSKYQDEGGTYASTWGPVSMNRYGSYYLNKSRTNEIYTDYMLSYNKQLNSDWSMSASAGYVGHTLRGDASNTWIGNATIDMAAAGQNFIKPGDPLPISDIINRFDPTSGGAGVTSKSKSSNWDQAALVTAQVGWKDVVFVDGSYRHDWYRPFKQFTYLGTNESYGYFGVGANAILSDIIKMPNWFTYAKYRLSYSEVGNSIPNVVYSAVSVNDILGTAGVSSRNRFTPIPEKTKSFETGIEMQFLRDCLTFDITYYNSAMHNSYLEIMGTNGKSQPVNSGIIRNQGIELTVGYDWKISRDWRWQTNVNFSYNHNKIEATSKDKYGNHKDMATTLANGKIQLLYRKDGSYGDIYITDFTRYKNDVYKYTAYEGYVDENNRYVYGDVVKYTTEKTVTTTVRGENDGEMVSTVVDTELTNKAGDIYITNGKPSLGGYATVTQAGKISIREANKKFNKYAGNLNSPYQLSWSNTFTYKDFSLFLLINGRIGGKVISLTEGYLDRYGASERTGQARLYAEKNNLYMEDGRHALELNEGRNRVAIEDYYTFIGTSDASSYIYNATNFRLRELSLGYTFRNLFGEYKNLSVSFVCRNLFFLYKDSPVDPDVSLSTANGLGGIDVFNYPSARQFGFNLKLNL